MASEEVPALVSESVCSAERVDALSVVIPACNASGHIADAIGSAFSAGADCVIVVDDGSTDGTARIATSSGAEVLSQSNQGAAAARRAGVALVGTEFVVLLDADDLVMADGVNKSLSLMRKGKHSYALGMTVGISRDGRRRILSHWPEGVSVPSLISRGHAPGPPGAVLWRTSALRSVLGEGLKPLWPRYAEDYEFLIRGALHGSVVVHDHLTCEYRWFGGKSSKAPRMSVDSAEEIRQHYAAHVGIDAPVRSEAERSAMVLLRRASEHSGMTGVVPRTALIVAAVLRHPSAAFLKLMRKLSLGA